MNIGMLTWHKALNHGAVLQAYALRQTVKNNGVDARLLDYDRKLRDTRAPLKKLTDRIRHLSPRYLVARQKALAMDAEKRKIFDAFINAELDVKRDWKNEKFDALVIGSDMVFNLRQGYSPYMFGVGVNAERIVSYAASAGGSTLRDVEKFGDVEEVCSALKRFAKIGCRDQETKDFVASVCGRTDLTDTIDPVLLYGFENERTQWDSGKWSRREPYMLVYAYHANMDDKRERKELRKFAKERGLKIVACGYWHSWCDEIVDASPTEFVEMFANANCVATDTFHGTVFSTIFHIPFVSIVRGNGFKLKYLLDQSGLSERIAARPEEIGEILKANVDWNAFERWLEAERVASKRFLLDAVLNRGEK